MSEEQAKRPAERGEAAPDPFAQARHDLRTPVNQIIGYSELLEEQAEEEGQADFIPDLKKIQKAARRQLELIDKYLSPAAAPGSATSAAPVEPTPAAPPPSRRCLPPNRARAASPAPAPTLPGEGSDGGRPAARGRRQRDEPRHAVAAAFVEEVTRWRWPRTATRLSR